MSEKWTEKTGMSTWSDNMSDENKKLREENGRLKAELAQFRHDERIGKVGFCAVTNCKFCPNPYAKPETRTNCSVHKGFKEVCGCP